MNHSDKILIADDDQFFCKITQKILTDKGYFAYYINEPSLVINKLSAEQFDLVLLDLKFKDANGIEILQEIKQYDPEIPVIVITGFTGIQTAVEAIKLGAYDYVPKEIEDEELLLKIEHALSYRKTTKQLEVLKETAEEKFNFQNIIGANKGMQEVFSLITSVCNTDATVLIRGETGTGKELAAKAIHFNSPRKNKPFFAINCAAISETLVESELFGHERGAFTGAHKQRIGKIELANGGTLFLDEIGDMSSTLQAKLLRFLQDKTFERIGGEKTLTADVRVIAATNKDLESLIKEEKFREDLYYRINLIQIKIPSLRERVDDIPTLVNHFIEKANKKYNKNIKGIDEEGMKLLVEHAWPGNVRELESLIERLALLISEGYLNRENISKYIHAEKEPVSGTIDTTLPLIELKDKVEKEYIISLMKKYHGNIQKVSDKAGITRAAIYQKLEKYNLNKEDFE